MKAIFKKNQIIITALAIMIAVVGYLNFAKDAEKEDEKEAKLTSGSSYTEGEDYGDLSAEDLGEDSYFTYQMSDNGEMVLKENRVAAGKTDGSDEVDSSSVTDQKDMEKEGMEKGNKEDGSGLEGTGKEENKDADKETSGEADKDKDGTKEDGDKKNGDGESTQTDGGAVPGEAVFTSVTIENGFFSNAKLTREQMRAKNKELLMSVVSDSAVADELKQQAIDEIIALTNRAECENAAEILLEAKGYSGVVVTLLESEVDVVVNAESITEQQIAQIEDIVSRKTGIGADGIVITTVIMEE
ncbi:MAG: SpoIIIAH-like family protein [Lachnospiraceae bacterium]|nr:SpoIIIAH-like family protein [Lachnospiraceae bacterium]